MRRIIVLTGLAMIAFAANSVLARLAFATADAEALSYTGIRLLAGTVTLAALVLLRERKLPVAGSWQGAAALAGYAVLFSIAYVALGAGTGALILFGSVQVGIIGWAVLKGDRPALVEWIGLAVAFAGLVYLLLPGIVVPRPLDALLMFLSGLCWAAYTLIGRGSASPLYDTTGNFIRTTPLALVLVVAGLVMTGQPHPLAILYAVLSGALASGLGYAIWYTALPALTRTRASLVQLTVPAIAALGGILFIGESLSPRLAVAFVAIIGGVAFALIVANRRRSRT